MGPPLATYDKRLIAGLIDYAAPYFAVFIVAIVLSAVSSTLGLLVSTLGYLGAFAWVLYNKYQEGLTGQSVGKKIAGARLVSELNGQPIGGGQAIGRYFVHILDGFCLVGYLFPLWDPKRQTFADKIMKTVVLAV